MATLPYLTATGNIEKALRGIKAAATPERVSQDFVKTILQIPGGSGDQVTSYLRKVGFANSDGTPSELYKKFRNSASSGAAAAEALKIGYGPLYKRNEYMHQLPDQELRGLIIEETGQGEDSSVVSLVLACIKAVKKFADWNPPKVDQEDKATDIVATTKLGSSSIPPVTETSESRKLGLNLAYTINLNLPATSDIAVFNSIFKSLKENLLRNSHE
jgi:hypothetical protein